LNIAVFASHNGSNLQAIIDACKLGVIKANVCVVISNNSSARALQRAKDASIDSYCLSTTMFGNEESLDAETLKILETYNTDIIFLAGYLKKIGRDILRKYHNRVFNIHPALLPKYGGKGMYGMNVHKAVIEAKDTVSGITIHRANHKYDDGEIIAQTIVAVSPDDTAETLAEKILAREHTFIVEILGKIVDGTVLIND